MECFLELEKVVHLKKEHDIQIMKDVAVIIVAAGSSSRFGGGDKQLALLDGLPVFLHSVRNFASVAAVMVIAVPAGRTEEFQCVAADYGYALPNMHFIEGGATRTASVQAALREVQRHQASGIVAIHDAARPLATEQMLLDLVALAREYGGAAPGQKVTDTILSTDAENRMTGAVPRDGLWRVSTPQVFQLSLLMDAYRYAGDTAFTDDTQVFFHRGYQVKILQETSSNVKITYQTDLMALSQRK